MAGEARWRLDGGGAAKEHDTDDLEARIGVGMVGGRCGMAREAIAEVGREGKE